MTLEKINRLLNENATSFFDSVDNNYLKIVIDQLGAKIYGICLSAENSFVDTNEKVLNLIETYRKCFDPNKIDIISLHLFLMTILNELEQIALNERNDKLQTVWSEIADLIFETSLDLKN